ncbi:MULTISPECIES: DUF3299 domain-containing protein [unclassified Vibrio]|uniref:DUF3299 domain-containing protein n=1 Tax=unclassified Vibrio TaxID=2614977 RepID=UPI00159D4909|nr:MULTISPECIES: DUF3299 domain-containing protein [unclassified Vibrio]NVN80364.1 DUF3299 domain-containing protein [Vibrio sp. Scap16]QLE95817.1 DUF3299 domain-containing protein [Vibrio sp. Scap24]
MKKLIAFTLILLGAAFGANASTYEELSWDDLIPESEKTMQYNFGGEASAKQSLVRHAIRPELNQRKIRIAGYFVPLESDGETISQILLVPYAGACIHVPPPPENQIIYVQFKEPMPIEKFQSVIYVSGTIKAEVTVNELANRVGYSLEGLEVEPYE